MGEVRADSNCGVVSIDLSRIASFMTLKQIIGELDDLDDDLTIYAERAPEWNESSEAELRPSGRAGLGGRFPYFLEIYVAKIVMKAWSHMRGGRVPNLEKKCEALIFYAENDAYILPEDERENH